MCNNVRNGFKDQKCPKLLSKVREQEGLEWKGLCEPLWDDFYLCKLRLPMRAPSCAKPRPRAQSSSPSAKHRTHRAVGVVVGMVCYQIAVRMDTW